MEDNLRIDILKNKLEQSRRRLQATVDMLHQREEEYNKISSQMNDVNSKLTSNNKHLKLLTLADPIDHNAIMNTIQIIDKDKKDWDELLEKRDKIRLDIVKLKKRVNWLQEIIDRSNFELTTSQTASSSQEYQPLDIPIISTDLFAKNLARLRQEKKLSMTKICESTGISRQALSNYLTGKTLPRLDAFVLLAMALDVSFDDLLLPSIDSDSYHIKKSEDQISISIPRGKITTDQISIIQQILNEFMKQNEK